MVELMVGPHRVEFSYCSTGSYDPWFLELIGKYGISVMVTDDIGNFMRFDGSVYKIRGGWTPYYDKFEVLGELYKEEREAVEKEIADTLASAHLEKRHSMDEIIDGWGVGGIRKLESITPTQKIEGVTVTGEVSEKTLENARFIFGHLVNKGCHRPTEDNITVSNGEIIFRITGEGICGAFEFSIKDDIFVITEKNYQQHASAYEVNKANVDAYIVSNIKKPRKPRESK